MLPAVLLGVAIALLLTRYDAERSVVYGRDHGDGHRGRERDPARQFCRTNPIRGRKRDGGRNARRTGPPPSRPDDRTAMIAGMIPIALGAAQTAPLGRAVIGGLIAATFATLFVLPGLYSILQAKAHAGSISLIRTTRKAGGMRRLSSNVVVFLVCGAIPVLAQSNLVKVVSKPWNVRSS